MVNKTTASARNYCHTYRGTQGFCGTRRAGGLIVGRTTVSAIMLLLNVFVGDGG